MKVGLFFGSFNPLHNAHLKISEKVIDKNLVSEVWFILTPKSPHKKTDKIIDKYIRLEMMKMVIDDIQNVKVKDIEFEMNEPNYTYLTLKKIQMSFPSNIFSIIMGEDNFKKLDSWKNSSYIKSNFKIISYPRNQGSVNNIFTDYYKISSSNVRRMIRHGSDISDYVPKKIYEYIKEKELYL